MKYAIFTSPTPNHKHTNQSNHRQPQSTHRFLYQYFGRYLPAQSRTMVMAVIMTVITGITGAMTTGCSNMQALTGKHDNGSLEYQSSRLLPPIQIPADKQTQNFTPLYPTVNLGDSPIKVTNDSGKQYQLPAPKRQVR